MNEIWKEIIGYEGLYEVSNLGKVRNIRTGRILKLVKGTDGYLHINLSKNGIVKKVRVHRLVAQAFLPNQNNYPEINHKNEEKSNNTVENLEWCSHEYNLNYGTRNERIAKRTSERLSKPVLQYDLQGKLIKEWPSMIKVEEETGMDHSNISKCCSGNRNSVGGYLWKYKN